MSNWKLANPVSKVKPTDLNKTKQNKTNSSNISILQLSKREKKRKCDRKKERKSTYIFKSLGSVRFFYVFTQGCVYFNEKTIILRNIIAIITNIF